MEDKVKRDYLLLFAIFAVALVVRAISITFINGFSAPLYDDGVDYDKIATNICSYGEGLTVWRAPLFPLFLSLIYFIFGHSYIAARMSLAILGSLNCILIFLVAREGFDKRVGYIAAFIFMFYPSLIYWNAFLYSETLLALLLTVAVLYFVKSSRAPCLRNFILAGFYAGLSTLTHSSAAFLCLFIPLWALLTFKPNYKLVLFASLCILGVTGVALSPWILRNYVVTKRFIPLTAAAGAISTHNPVILRKIEHGSYFERWGGPPHFVSPETCGLLTSAESLYVGRIWNFRYPLRGINNKRREKEVVEACDFLRKKWLNYVINNPGAVTKIALHQIPIFFSYLSSSL